jgi:hypothetical protein
MRFVHRSSGLVALLLAGCWQGNYWDRTDGINPRNEPVRIPKNLPPGSTETASRVYSVGQDVLAKNPQLSLRPLFSAIGSNEETVFHSGFSHIYISDGLVKKCRTDAELAGVLCLELGKMVSEREVQVAAQSRDDDRDPLLAPRFSDVAGSSFSADMTQQAELARYQKERPKKRASAPVPPPDPRELAVTFFTKAGYQAEELDRVEPLLRTAERNPKFEKQLNNGPAQEDGGLGIPVPKK